MRTPEGKWEWSPIEDYRPEDVEEMELYTGSDAPVPLPDIITGGSDFAWLGLSNYDHTLYIFNVILKEHPESYCQVQILPQAKKQYLYQTFFVEERVEMPEDDIEVIIQQGILPFIADQHAKMN